MGLLFIKGFCIGLFYTFSFLPEMVLVTRTVIERSKKVGCAAFLGSLAATLLYAFLGAMLLYLFELSSYITLPFQMLTSATILFVLSLNIYRKRMEYRLQTSKATPLPAPLLSTFFAALKHPIRALGYGALFAALQVHPKSAITLLLLLIGVSCGGSVWWIIYVLSTKSSASTTAPKVVQQCRRYAALALIFFSFIALSPLFL